MGEWWKYIHTALEITQKNKILGIRDIAPDLANLTYIRHHTFSKHTAWVIASEPFDGLGSRIHGGGMGKWWKYIHTALEITKKNKIHGMGEIAPDFLANLTYIRHPHSVNTQLSNILTVIQRCTVLTF
jgi:hypothetical protein